MVDAGYVIYDPSNPSEKFYFDKALDSRGVKEVATTHNTNRLELKTFGEVPYVYYAGNTDYVSFELDTVFYYHDEVKETARSQMDRFKEMIKLRKTLYVENSQGQLFKCDVELLDERSPNLYVDEFFDFIEVRVRCTEIDK